MDTVVVELQDYELLDLQDDNGIPELQPDTVFSGSQAGAQNHKLELELQAETLAEDGSEQALILQSEPLADENEWQPGANCGPWIRRSTPIVPQSQVLITNVVLALKRAPEL